MKFKVNVELIGFQVRLICNDGTRYTKDVDIVRKCACTKKCYWLTNAAIHNSNTQPLEPSTANIENGAEALFDYDDLTQIQTSILPNLDLDDSNKRILDSARRPATQTQTQTQINNNQQQQQEPLKLTFFVNDEENNTHDKHLNDASNIENDSHSSRYYYPDFDENNPDVKVAKLARNSHHDPTCLLSAFLYFTTITSFTYLVIIWIKQRMHVQMAVLHWWWGLPC